MPIYNVNFTTTLRETIQIEAKDYDEAFELSSYVTPKHYSGDESDAEISHEADVTLASDYESNIEVDRNDADKVATFLDKLNAKLKIVK